MIASMSDRDKPKSDKPNPVEDLRKGLGLLFRAAKATIEQLPTEKLEEVVVSSAKEVGRAIENVTQTVEKQIFGKSHGAPPPVPPHAPTDSAQADADAAAAKAKAEREAAEKGQ
jgi:hypothetical protein